MFCDVRDSIRHGELLKRNSSSFLVPDRNGAWSQGSNPAETAERILQELTFWESPQKSRAQQVKSHKHGNNPNAKTCPRLPMRIEDTQWRKAADPSSGRIYYYHVWTRETQWEKPEEIRAMERRVKAEKRRKDRVFFNEMEKNIYKSLERGERIPGVAIDSPHMMQSKDTMQSKEPKKETNKQDTSRPVAPRARTISGMNENLLAELSGGKTLQVTTTITVTTTSVVPARDLTGRPPLPVSHRILNNESSMSDDSLGFSPEHTSGREAREDSSELAGERLLDDASSDVDGTSLHKNHVRRNTGSTIFVKSTMTNPDIGATIKCVCGVFRAHIVQATSKRIGSPVSTMSCPYGDLSTVFRDYNWKKSQEPKVPSLEDVVALYEDFYKRSQMEHDTIIMSLIYVERLIKESTIAPVPDNWMSVLLSCMVLASKVWDDLSMWNVDFSNVCGRGRLSGLESFTLPRINQLELALLKSLNFNVKVPASEYAKYYFLIRSMLMKSGFLEEGGGQKEKQRPLDMVEARKLETLSANYQKAALSSEELACSTRRSMSLDDYDFFSPERTKENNIHKKGDAKPRGGPMLQQSVCLEQLVSMKH